jgi:hypothetical protein
MMAITIGITTKTRGTIALIAMSIAADWIERIGLDSRSAAQNRGAPGNVPSWARIDEYQKEAPDDQRYANSTRRAGRT